MERADYPASEDRNGDGQSCGEADQVRVKYGTAHRDFPDIPLGGWAGTVNQLNHRLFLCRRTTAFGRRFGNRTLSGRGGQFTSESWKRQTLGLHFLRMAGVPRAQEGIA